MENDFYGSVEILLDDLLTRVKLLEEAVTQIPQINMQPDPSRPAGVIVIQTGEVEPAGLPEGTP
jgi:hypothetical protein